MKIYFFGILSIVFIVIVYFLRQQKFNRHKYNWKKAINIKRKLDEFKGEGLNARKLNYLRKIDPFVFEELLLYSFKQNGAKIIRNKRYTNDGGIDGKVIDEKGKSLIQAKRYSNHINLKHVKEFSNLITTDKWANHGYFIHTGRTGKGVYQAIGSGNITLISGEKLINLISKNT